MTTYSNIILLGNYAGNTIPININTTGNVLINADQLKPYLKDFTDIKYTNLQPYTIP